MQALTPCPGSTRVGSLLHRHSGGDDMADDASYDGKWLTYQQLAEIRRISKSSAIRLVMRRHWRRQRDNERVVRILVPPDMLEPDRAPHDASDDAPDDASDDTRSIIAGALAALEDAVAVLREQLAAANARADRAEQGRNGEVQRADDLRERIEVLNAEILVAREAATEDGRRVEAMQTEIAEMETTRDRARAEAQAAQDAAEALRRADAERRAQGLLVRLRAAWQGR